MTYLKDTHFGLHTIQPPYLLRMARWSLVDETHNLILPTGDASASLHAYKNMNARMSVNTTSSVDDIGHAFSANMSMANPHISSIVAACKNIPHSGNAFPSGAELWNRVVIGCKGVGDHAASVRWRKCRLEDVGGPIHPSYEGAAGVIDYYTPDDQCMGKLGDMDVMIDKDLPLLGPLKVVCQNADVQPSYRRVITEAGDDGSFELADLVLGDLQVCSVGVQQDAEYFKLSGVSLEAVRMLVHATSLVGFPVVGLLTSHVLEGGDVPPSELIHNLSLLPTSVSRNRYEQLAYAPAPRAVISAGGTKCESREVDHLVRFLPTPPNADGTPVLAVDQMREHRVVDVMEAAHTPIWYHARFSLQLRSSTKEDTDSAQSTRLDVLSKIPSVRSDEERQIYSVLQTWGEAETNEGPPSVNTEILAAATVHRLSLEKRDGVEEVSVHSVQETIPTHNMEPEPGDDMPADDTPRPPRDQPVEHRYLWSSDIVVDPMHAGSVSFVPPGGTNDTRCPVMQLPVNALVIQEGVLMPIHSQAHPATSAGLLNCWPRMQLVQNPASPDFVEGMITLPAAQKCAAACLDRGVFRLENTSHIPPAKRNKTVRLEIVYECGDPEEVWLQSIQEEKNVPRVHINTSLCNNCGECEKFFHTQTTKDVMISVEPYCSLVPRELLDSTVSITRNILSEAPARFQHILPCTDTVGVREENGRRPFSMVKDVEDMYCSTKIQHDPTRFARKVLTAEWVPVDPV